MNTTNQFATAIAQEKHPAVRRVMGLNAWKIKTWREYASWKRHARNWVAIDWRQRQYEIEAQAGFVEAE